MNSCSEWQITYLFWYLSASVCHVRWCSLCVPFGVFISIQREAHPFLGMSKIKSATPLTAPSYFIRAPVLVSRLPPLGTAKAYEPVWDIVTGTIPNNHVVFGFLIMVLSVSSYSSVE